MGEALIVRTGGGKPKYFTQVGGGGSSQLIGAKGFMISVSSATDSSGYSKGTIMSVYYDGTTLTATYATSGSMSSAINISYTTGTFTSNTGAISISGP